ncbi:hypothetical protein KJ836_02845 [Patescibacteria group bacterium]|nr:hypothetical protein [Patescibacteria group bacterium]
MTEINLNQAECLKPINNFGNTVYQNVCDGTVTQVPWGSGDWLVVLFFVAIVVSAIYVVKISTED